ncbi:tRNA-dependent cyclodipeptide synthase [Streptomyces sp. NPDC019531]|uniref:tRNA-dependent cyclodipeptide synthase n=1 Tax=Streptomyces sp. NPDC019531 TaxID=3365062 RepID=UPI00384CB013
MFLGISPGNGYFSEERLVALLRRAAARFTGVEIAHPDTETVARTCLGRGYEPRHARARAYRDDARRPTASPGPWPPRGSTRPGSASHSSPTTTTPPPIETPASGSPARTRTGPPSTPPAPAR